MAWLVLIASAVLEAVWASALGMSDGMSRPVPTVIFLVAVTLSMIGLGKAARSIPIGTAYAVWVGIGAALTVGYAMVTGSEAVSAAKLVFIGGIIAAVIGLKLVPSPAPGQQDTTNELEHHDGDVLGWCIATTPPRISLRRGLLQAQRRSTLTHELVHLERGPLADHAVLDAREEEAVEREAARRLIPLDRLVWAMQWSRDEYEVADKLWVDVDIVHARLRSLTPAEELQLQTLLDEVTERLERYDES